MFIIYVKYFIFGGLEVFFTDFHMLSIPSTNGSRRYTFDFDVCHCWMYKDL